MRRLIFASLLLTGCSKTSDVTVYKVPKEVAPAPHGPGDGHDHGTPPPMGAPDMGAPGMNMGAVPEGVENAPASTGLTWKDPSGWKREAGSGMRVATYALGDGTECSVVSLPGAAGGDLANVNRWRGQMGLSDVGTLQGLATPLKTPLGTSLLVDFEGAGAKQGQRLVAVIVTDGGTSWFFKLTGPIASVNRAKPNLIKLLGTLNRA